MADTLYSPEFEQIDRQPLAPVEALDTRGASFVELEQTAEAVSQDVLDVALTREEVGKAFDEPEVARVYFEYDFTRHTGIGKVIKFGYRSLHVPEIEV